MASVLAQIERSGSPPDHQPRGLQGSCHVGQLEGNRLLLGNRPTEGPPLQRVIARRVECPRGGTNGARRYVDAPAIQARHRVAKTLAIGTKPVRGRNPDVPEMHQRSGLVAPAHLLFLGSEGKSVRVSRYQQAGDSARSCIARPAHDRVDVHGARTRYEGLGAVQAIAGISFRLGTSAQRSSIRPGFWLCETVGGDPLHARETRQPDGTHAIVSESIHHPGNHVVDAEKRSERNVRSGEFLERQRGLQPAKS